MKLLIADGLLLTQYHAYVTLNHVGEWRNWQTRQT